MTRGLQTHVLFEFVQGIGGERCLKVGSMDRPNLVWDAAIAWKIRDIRNYCKVCNIPSTVCPIWAMSHKSAVMANGMQAWCLYITQSFFVGLFCAYYCYALSLLVGCGVSVPQLITHVEVSATCSWK
jgi:hypothetical protein